MVSMILILVFVAALGFPGFYIITRKVFAKGSKRVSFWLSIGLTVLLVGVLLGIMSGVQI